MTLLHESRVPYVDNGVDSFLGTVDEQANKKHNDVSGDYVEVFVVDGNGQVLLVRIWDRCDGFHNVSEVTRC